MLALTGTLEALNDETTGEEVSVVDVVEALNSRGYGPLLIGPALITILPTGAIPGVPAVCALLIIFISAQILIKKSHPWLPKKLRDFNFKREKLLSALNKAKPYTQKVDKLIYPRIRFLTGDAAKPVIAISSILLSLAIIVLGFIPFLAALPAAGILLLGLGLSGRDGLFVILAFLICLISLSIVPVFWATITG